MLLPLGEPAVEAIDHTGTHPFLPTLALAAAHDFPTIAAYEGAACAQAADALLARWTELTPEGGHSRWTDDADVPAAPSR